MRHRVFGVARVAEGYDVHEVNWRTLLPASEICKHLSVERLLRSRTTDIRFEDGTSVRCTGVGQYLREGVARPRPVGPIWVWKPHEGPVTLEQFITERV